MKDTSDKGGYLDLSIMHCDQYKIGNICTRHQCEQGRWEKTALRWISAHQGRTDYSFNDLNRELEI